MSAMLSATLSVCSCYCHPRAFVFIPLVAGGRVWRSAVDCAGDPSAPVDGPLGGLAGVLLLAGV